MVWHLLWLARTGHQIWAYRSLPWVMGQHQSWDTSCTNLPPWPRLSGFRKLRKPTNRILPAVTTDLGKAVNPDGAEVKLEQTPCTSMSSSICKISKGPFKPGHEPLGFHTHLLPPVQWSAPWCMVLWEIYVGSTLGKWRDRGGPELCDSHRCGAGWAHLGAGQLCWPTQLLPGFRLDALV